MANPNMNMNKNLNLPNVINEGERNLTLFNYGAALKRSGASLSDVERMLKEANVSKCKPSLGEGEVTQITCNVFTYCNDESKPSPKKNRKAPVKLDKSIPSTEQAARQLEAMFRENELITFVTEFYKDKEGKFKPGKKVISRLSQKVIKELRSAKSMEEVFPGYNKQAGILLCVNPMEYGSRKDKDVTVFRSALIEYDDISIDEQERRLLDSGLPICSITFSGGKSLHATVRVDAENADEYKKKVKALHEKLKEQYGTPCDTANKNPSRLTRLAGSQRGKRQQVLLYAGVNLDAKIDDFLKKDEAAEEKKDREGKLGFNEVARILIEEYGARYANGVPFVKQGGDCLYGYEEIYKAILGIRDDARAGFRREVAGYLDLMAPKCSQADCKYIRFKNGILNIETMELLPDDGNLLIINQIPHNWNPDAQAPLVDKVFNDIALGDDAVIANFWEMFGLSMYRGHEVSRLILLQGAGANGKSTLLGMLKCMLGESNCFSLSVQDLGEKFQLVPAVGKLALVGDDIASDGVGQKACAVMKKFVTGETVCDQHKGGATFQFEPYATLIYSCNETPRFADSSFGFERRIHPIPLSARFTPATEGYDPRLKDKLCKEECLEYAIVNSVEALKRCLESLTLTPNKLSDEMKGDMLHDNDPVLFYIEERKAMGYSFVGKTNSEVYGDYKEWCALNHYDSVPLTSLSRTLRSREGIRSVSSNGVRKYAFLNAS